MTRQTNRIGCGFDTRIRTYVSFPCLRAPPHSLEPAIYIAARPAPVMFISRPAIENNLGSFEECSSLLLEDLGEYLNA